MYIVAFAVNIGQDEAVAMSRAGGLNYRAVSYRSDYISPITAELDRAELIPRGAPKLS